ncbi:TPA: EexN family lipoprotein [Vibrio diabolicus]
MKGYLQYITLVFTFFLVACSEEVKTVDYYQTHHKERIEKVEECKNNVENEMTTNCTNAIKAASKIRLDARLNTN